MAGLLARTRFSTLIGMWAGAGRRFFGSLCHARPVLATRCVTCVPSAFRPPPSASARPSALGESLTAHGVCGVQRATGGYTHPPVGPRRGGRPRAALAPGPRPPVPRRLRRRPAPGRTPATCSPATSCSATSNIAYRRASGRGRCKATARPAGPFSAFSNRIRRCGSCRRICRKSGSPCSATPTPSRPSPARCRGIFRGPACNDFSRWSGPRRRCRSPATPSGASGR